MVGNFKGRVVRMLNIMLYGYKILENNGAMFQIVLYMIMFDVLTGVLVAGKEREINSSINLNGLIRKLGMIVAIAFVSMIDEYLHMEGEITEIGLIFLIANESMSIIENFSKIGINLRFITKYFDANKISPKEGEIDNGKQDIKK